MTRTALPTNYELRTGEVLTYFTPADWEIGSNGTKSDDAVNYLGSTPRTNTRGTSSVAGGSFTFDKTISTVFDGVEYIELWYYLHSNTDVITSIQMYIATSGAYSKYFFQNSHRFQGGSTGWNCVRFNIADFVANGGVNWKDTMTRIRIGCNTVATKTFDITFDRIVIKRKLKPKILFTFDDAWKGVYTYAYPMFQEKWMKFTTWVNSSFVTDNRYMSTAELQTVYANGHDVGNHTHTHPVLTSLTDAQIRSEILTTQNYILDNNMPRAAYHLCYPSGAFNDNVINIAKSLGVLSARSTIGGIEYYPVSSYSPYFDMYKIRTVGITNTTVFNSASPYGYKQFIDYCIRDKATMVFMLHDVDPTPADLKVSSVELQKAVDYIYARRNEVDVVTVSQWYNGLAGYRVAA